MRNVAFDFQTPLLTQPELIELRFFVRAFALDHTREGNLRGLSAGLQDRLNKDFGEGYEVQLLDDERTPCNDDEFHSDTLILLVRNSPTVH